MSTTFVRWTTFR